MTLAIEVRALVKRYGDLVAVGGLDLEVEAGTCQGLLGPNGAGKSTTVNALVGLITADEGEVKVLGRGWTEDPGAIRERIGVQLQETQFSDKLSVAEILRLFASFYRDRRPVGEVLELVGLEEKAGDRYVNLSGGQKQRLALGCALVNRPEILFLDEPTTGLDPQARRRVWEVVNDFKDGGGTVLLTTHYMDEAEQLCDHIVIVDHGKSISEGSPREIIDSLDADSLIELELSDEPGEGAQEELCTELAALDEVIELARDGSRVRLQVKRPRDALPRVLAAIESSGHGFADLHTHRPTLEDVFVSLTGRHLRDG